MRKFASIVTGLIVFSLALCAAPAISQEGKAQATPEARTTPPGDIHYYRLEFINSRSYHTSVSSNGKSSSVRTGTKIPVHTNEKGDIAYLDVGVNLDCYLTQGLRRELACRSLLRAAASPAPAPAWEPRRRQFSA